MHGTPHTQSVRFSPREVCAIINLTARLERGRAYSLPGDPDVTVRALAEDLLTAMTVGAYPEIDDISDDLNDAIYSHPAEEVIQDAIFRAGGEWGDKIWPLPEVNKPPMLATLMREVARANRALEQAAKKSRWRAGILGEEEIAADHAQYNAVVALRCYVCQETGLSANDAHAILSLI